MAEARQLSLDDVMAMYADDRLDKIQAAQARGQLAAVQTELQTRQSRLQALFEQANGGPVEPRT